MTITSEPPIAPGTEDKDSRPPSRAIPIGVACMVVAALIVAAVLLFSGNTAPVRVPNVVSMTESAAVRDLGVSHLTAGILNLSQSRPIAPPIGIVLSQTPAAGVSVARNSVVQIQVDGPNSIVPNVVGLSAITAESELTTAGFNYHLFTTTALCSQSGVVSQSPPGGTTAVVSTTVKLVEC